MGSYLPENTYMVCLNQLGKEYKQLKVSDLREFKTVKLNSQERPFLILLDKKLSDNFTCKSSSRSEAGTATLKVEFVAEVTVADNYNNQRWRSKY